MASLMDETRSMLNKLLTAQEHERKKMEEQMPEEAHHLHNFQASYQKMVDDSRKFEVITKNVEQVIITARADIAKAEALIQINEQKFVTVRGKLEELEVAKKLVQEEHTALSHFVETRS